MINSLWSDTFSCLMATGTLTYTTYFQMSASHLVKISFITQEFLHWSVYFCLSWSTFFGKKFSLDSRPLDSLFKEGKCTAGIWRRGILSSSQVAPTTPHYLHSGERGSLLMFYIVQRWDSSDSTSITCPFKNLKKPNSHYVGNSTSLCNHGLNTLFWCAL